MNFEIVLTERSQSQRTTFHLYEMFRISKVTETESKLVVARSKREKREWRVTSNGYWVSLGVREIFYN
jgi:hypothetical protein